jgi:hypothetical protein
MRVRLVDKLRSAQQLPVIASFGCVRRQREHPARIIDAAARCGRMHWARAGRERAGAQLPDELSAARAQPLGHERDRRGRPDDLVRSIRLPTRPCRPAARRCR